MLLLTEMTGRKAKDRPSKWVIS